MKGEGVIKKILVFLIPLACVMVAAMMFWVLYRVDNKYTAPGPRGLSGLITVGADTLAETPVLYLVHGWAYYDGQLLTPEDFSTRAIYPDDYIYIGQFGGFERDNLSASPHGSASYRLHISVPDSPQAYALEVPEIYSAYILYINGEKVLQMGQTEKQNFKSQTGTRSLVFEADGSIDIVIAVADYAHVYSGMVYPPAFGLPQAVSHRANLRLTLRSLVCAMALIVGVLAAMTGIIRRQYSLSLLYGLLCLAFVGYCCYPILHTLFPGRFLFFYAIEKVCFCAMLLLAVLLQNKAGGVGEKMSRWIMVAGLLLCLSSAAVSVTAGGGNSKVLAAYSLVIATCKWATAAYLVICSGLYIRRGVAHSLGFFCAGLVFACALVMDRLFPSYEPIVTGWFIEIASFFMVIAIGFSIAQDVAQQFQDNAVLQERAKSMERLAGWQQRHFTLLQQQIQDAMTARHDLRHHFVALSGLIEKGEHTKLAEYIRQYSRVLPGDAILTYSENPIVNVLAHHYARRCADCGIAINWNLDVGETAGISDIDLCIIVSNLLENAVEACERNAGADNSIGATILQRQSALYIQVQNSVGTASHHLARLQRSAKQVNRQGYGLHSIRTVVKRYQGSAEFRYDKESGQFYSLLYMPSKGAPVSQ